MANVARSAHLGIAWLLVIGLAFQVFLAGLGVFAGAGNFATHRDTGYLLQLLPVLMAVAAGVGRLGRREVILPLVIVALFFLQSILIALRDASPAIAALHPLNGFLIVYLAIQIARAAWVRRTAGATPATGSLATETP